MGHGGQVFGVGDQAVEELIVPFGVDQAGPWALELVAHAARAPNLHVERLVVAFDGFANRLAQGKAAGTRGHGVLHHIDVEGYHQAGPLGGAAKHQVQRHGQAVIDLQVIDDGQVKVLLNDRLRNVRGQARVALDLGHGARAVAFVGRLELGGGADGKGGDHAQVKVGGVVVVDEEDHVGRVLFHPLFAGLEAFEHGGPVIVAGLAVVHRRADGRYVRGEHRGGDAGLARCGVLAGGIGLGDGLGQLVLGLPFFPCVRLAHWALRVAVFADEAVALGAAATGEHHLAVLLLGHAGHAAGHLLKTQAVGRAQFGQEVDVAAGAHHPVQVPRPHGGTLLVGHGPFGQVGIFILLEAGAVVRLHQAHAELVEPVAFAALVGIKNGRAGHVQIGFFQGHGCLLGLSVWVRGSGQPLQASTGASGCPPAACVAAGRWGRCGG